MSTIPLWFCPPRIERWRPPGKIRTGRRLNVRHINMRAWILAQDAFVAYRDAMLKEYNAGSLPPASILEWMPSLDEIVQTYARVK